MSPPLDDAGVVPQGAPPIPVYDYLVLLDFKLERPVGALSAVKEVTEWSWMLVEAATGQVADQKQIFVKWVRDSIQPSQPWQSAVANLLDAVKQFDSYLFSTVSSNNRSFCIVCDQPALFLLREECRRHEVRVAAHFERWFVLEQECRKAYPQLPMVRGVPALAELLGVSLDQMPQNALENCQLLFVLVSKLLKDGHPFDTPYSLFAERERAYQVSMPAPVPAVPQGTALFGFVKLRGLPWEVSVDDVKQFMSPIPVVDGGIFVCTNREGRSTGEAFVQLCSKEDVKRAIEEKHRKNLGRRYIEVFEVAQGDMEGFLRMNSAIPSMAASATFNPEHVSAVRLRGLPFNSMESDVLRFFEDLPVTVVENGVWIIYGADGRSTGEAYVVFEQEQHASIATQKDRERMGTRYIEMFEVSTLELQLVLKQMFSAVFPVPGVGSQMGQPSYFDHSELFDPRWMTAPGIAMGVPPFQGPSPYPPANQPAPMAPVTSLRHASTTAGHRRGRGGAGPSGGFTRRESGGAVLRMRGLPYNVTPEEILAFFNGFEVDPSSISIGLERDGRPSGEASVCFSTEKEAERAKRERHGKYIGARYVELFPF